MFYFLIIYFLRINIMKIEINTTSITVKTHMKAQVQISRNRHGEPFEIICCKETEHLSLEHPHRKHKPDTAFKPQVTEYRFPCLLPSHSFSPKEKEYNLFLVSASFDNCSPPTSGPHQGQYIFYSI